MSIDWSKAPEGFDTHIVRNGIARFYKEKSDRYIRDNGFFIMKEDIVHLEAVVTKNSALWTGEGLPPVGTVCENIFSSGLWKPVLVVAHDNGLAVFRTTEESINYFSDVAKNFRPIPTAKQIAENTRHKENLTLADELATFSDREPGERHLQLAEYLYERGYRKQKSE